MNSLNQNECVLFIVDIQEKLVNAVFNKDVLLKKSEVLAKASTILEVPTLVSEQYPKGLGETIPVVKSFLSSDTKYYEKTAFNALADENLINDLKTLNKKQVLVVGIEAHICVYQTVQALLEQGFDVTVIADSCGSRYEVEYNSALDSMKALGAKIKTTEMVLFELLKTAKHPKFKEIQALIK